LNENTELDSYQKLEAKQQPNWPDQAHLAQVRNTLSNLPPLVFAGEVDNFKSKIAEAQPDGPFYCRG